MKNKLSLIRRNKKRQLKLQRQAMTLKVPKMSKAAKTKKARKMRKQML